MEEQGIARVKFIERRGNQYCVTTQSGKTIACHTTRASALAQLRAIEANKGYDGTVTKGPLCMELLEAEGMSKARAHNVCYADDISAGRKQEMEENENESNSRY